jgi:hypothetical protein
MDIEDEKKKDFFFDVKARTTVHSGNGIVSTGKSQCKRLPGMTIRLKSGFVDMSTCLLPTVVNCLRKAKANQAIRLISNLFSFILVHPV